MKSPIYKGFRNMRDFKSILIFGLGFIGSEYILKARKRFRCQNNKF